MPPLRLHPVPPYDFDLSAAIFAGGDPNVRDFRDGTLRMALVVSGTPVLVEVTSTGTTDKPDLHLSVRTAPAPPPSIRDDCKVLVTRILNLNEDPAPFIRAVAGDRVMTSIAAGLYGLRVSTTPTVFEALVDSIIEQQISLVAAHAMQSRLVRAAGTRFAVENADYFCYPGPEALAGTSDETYRACGLSRRKAEYIRDLSREIATGSRDVEGLRNAGSTGDIIAALGSIRGVGRWTAELTALRGLHRLDAFPADDLGLRRLIGRYYLHGAMPTAEEAGKIADRWGEWKGLAAFCLVVSQIREAHHVPAKRKVMHRAGSA